MAGQMETADRPSLATKSNPGPNYLEPANVPTFRSVVEFRDNIEFPSSACVQQLTSFLSHLRGKKRLTVRFLNDDVAAFDFQRGDGSKSTPWNKTSNSQSSFFKQVV